jgi:hypothetical protein
MLCVALLLPLSRRIRSHTQCKVQRGLLICVFISPEGMTACQIHEEPGKTMFRHGWQKVDHMLAPFQMFILYSNKNGGNIQFALAYCPVTDVSNT